MSEFLTRKEAIIKGENLTPMSRAEAMLKKEDIPVFTRKESLIKEALNSGGSGEIEVLRNVSIQTGGEDEFPVGSTIGIDYCSCGLYDINNPSLDDSSLEVRMAPCHLSLGYRDLEVLDGVNNPPYYVKKTIMRVDGTGVNPVPEGFGFAIYAKDPTGAYAGRLIYSTPPLGTYDPVIDPQLYAEYLDTIGVWEKGMLFSFKKDVRLFFGVISNK